MLMRLVLRSQFQVFYTMDWVLLVWMLMAMVITIGESVLNRPLVPTVQTKRIAMIHLL